MEYIDTMLRNYSYLNVGLKLNFNGTEYKSENGLLDLLNDSMVEEPLYPYPPKEWGHRNSLHPRQRLRGEYPLLCQRTKYNSGRYTPLGI